MFSLWLGVDVSKYVESFLITDASGRSCLTKGTTTAFFSKPFKLQFIYE